MSDAPDYDSPWKEILDAFFEDFMAFFFPQAHAAIDWQRGTEFLDKELQKITADAALGRRYADKLVKLWLKGGTEVWVLIHVEVQGDQESGFELRIYVYNRRIFERVHHEALAGRGVGQLRDFDRRQSQLASGGISAGIVRDADDLSIQSRQAD